MFRATRVVRQATSVTKSLDPQAAREFVLSLSPEGRTAIVNALELTSKRDAEVAFKLADQNQDSFLTRREFSRWYEQRLQHAAHDAAPATAAAGAITRRQYILQFTRSAIPFVGFGFLDNSIMLISGDLINDHIGSVLHLSMMASAALGNAVSDVAGIGFGQFIEASTERLGVPNPHLSAAQLAQRSILATRMAGNMLGILTGCLLGMTPLLFLHTS